MSIDYKLIDKERVRDEVEEQRAREADTAAYSLELEQKRLEIQASKVPANERDNFNVTLAASKKEAARARARANRLGKNVETTLEQTAQDKRNLVKSHIFAIESEHAARTLMVEQRQAALAMKGKDAPSEEERIGLVSRLEEELRAVQVLEDSWQVYVAELELLPPEPEQPVAPIEDATPPRPKKPIVEKPHTPPPVNQ